MLHTSCLLLILWPLFVSDVFTSAFHQYVVFPNTIFLSYFFPVTYHSETTFFMQPDKSGYIDGELYFIDLYNVRKIAFCIPVVFPLLYALATTRIRRTTRIIRFIQFG